jgi:hypothetical protein
MARSDDVRAWLADIRSLAPNEEAIGCQWPGCDGPADVWIWPVAAHGREGVACASHGRAVLNAIPPAEITQVAIYGDPMEPGMYDGDDIADIRAILGQWPEARQF